MSPKRKRKKRRLRRVIILDALSVKDKATLIIREALSLTVRLHKFLQLR